MDDQVRAKSASVGAGAAGALAVGAFAFGALAVGALANGALAVGRLTIGTGKFKRLEVDELTVTRLRIEKVEGPAQLGSAKPMTLIGISRAAEAPSADRVLPTPLAD